MNLMPKSRKKGVKSPNNDVVLCLLCNQEIDSNGINFNILLFPLFLKWNEVMKIFNQLLQLGVSFLYNSLEFCFQ
jgi:hypothetical protein